MGLYRSRPQTVEAIQWTGDNVGELWDTFGAGTIYGPTPDLHGPDLLLLAGKDERRGWVPVPVGHWVVRPPGDNSDVWCVSPDYFVAKYEPAEAEGEG